jgi:hypothetical protein
MKEPWRCLTCGARVDPYIADTSEPAFKTYGRVVGMLANSIGLKRLPASGDEPTHKSMCGFTSARPVRVAKLTRVGKEVIVDPTDVAEGLTAEELGATIRWSTTTFVHCWTTCAIRWER